MNDEKKEVVPPRTAPEFVELQQKYLPPLVSPRGQPMRKIKFIGLGKPCHFSINWLLSL